MAGIKLFTDSTNDLSPELIERHEIGVVPLYVTFGTESYRDGIDMNPGQLFFDKVRQTGVLPKTSAPSPADFYAAFRPYAEQGMDVVYIGLSSALSSTVQNALLASEQLPGVSISVIDSRNLSTGIGLLLLKAADARAQGAVLPEIEDLVKETVPKIETSFVIDTLEYLHKGGRVSNLQHLLGSLLKIRPIVKVADGGMIPAEKKFAENVRKRWKSWSATCWKTSRPLIPGVFFLSLMQCPWRKPNKSGRFLWTSPSRRKSSSRKQAA